MTLKLDLRVSLKRPLRVFQDNVVACNICTTILTLLDMAAVNDTQSVTSNLTSTDLAQLVNKLERTITSSDPEALSEQKKLRRCSIERRKVGAVCGSNFGLVLDGARSQPLTK